MAYGSLVRIKAGYSQGIHKIIYIEEIMSKKHRIHTWGMKNARKKKKAAKQAMEQGLTNSMQVVMNETCHRKEELDNICRAFHHKR